MRMVFIYGIFLSLLITSLSTITKYTKTKIFETEFSQKDVLPIATEADLAEFMSLDFAKQLLPVSKNIYRYFVFSDTGPRYSAPPKDHEFFNNNSGLCDTMVRVLRKLIPQNIIVDQLNMIVPYEKSNDGNEYIFRGHSIAVISTSNGQIAIDPTYGFLLLTKNDFFNIHTFRHQDYKIFTLFEKPFDVSGNRSLSNGKIFYTKLGLDDAAVAKSGEKITVTTPIIQIRNGSPTKITQPRITNNQITWTNHIGYYYEPTTHIWRFHVKKTGKFKITFGLTSDGLVKNKVLDQPLSVEIKPINTNDTSLSEKVITNANSFEVIVNTERNQFALAISSKTVSARLLDYICVEQIET